MFLFLVVTWKHNRKPWEDAVIPISGLFCNCSPWISVRAGIWLFHWLSWPGWRLGNFLSSSCGYMLVIERVKSQWFELKMGHKRLDLESHFAGNKYPALITGSYQPATLIWLLTLATAETEREKWEVAIDWQSIGTEVLSSAPGKMAHSPANCSLQIPGGILWHGIAGVTRPML